MKELLIRGAQVFDSERGVFSARDVYIRNGFFADPSDASTACPVCDYTGRYLAPGLIDVHTHGRAGFDFNRHERMSFPKILASYAAAGTTAVMATLASDTKDSLFASMEGINRVRQNESTPGCARILGIHLEGRYLNPEKRGAHDLALLAQPALPELEEMVFRMRPLPIHISAAPELEGGMAFFRRARELGATCGIAHSNADDATAREAMANGATSFTHLYNAMRQLHHREPGNTGVGLVSDAYAELICDGQHVHPDMVRLAYLCKGRERLVLITDSMEAAGCPDGEYEIAGLPVTVADGRAVTHEGALAGSLLSLFDGVINLCRFAGASYPDALLCATRNPAEMIGAYDRVGSIAPGKAADLLVLDGQTVTERKYPQLVAVCVGGIFIK